MKEEVGSLQMYTDCITKNSEAILKALDENDFCAISVIFKRSGVPDNKMKPLMGFLLNSYFQRWHDW